MPKYTVGIREVHISSVVVDMDETATQEEIYREAKRKHEDLDTMDVEYSHTMNEEHWTIYKY